MLLNVVGALGLFAFWIAFRDAKGVGFLSGVALVASAWMLGLVIVVAIRPPMIQLRHDGIAIRRFWRSTEVDREHYSGYTFRRINRVVGGESNSSNRDLFISYRLVTGSTAAAAFWCLPLCGLVMAQEQRSFKAKLDQWHSEVSVAPVS